MTTVVDSRLIYKKIRLFNNSFRKEEYQKIPCAQGIQNLNDGGEKTFEFNYDQKIAYLRDSMIMEIFEVKDTVDTITLQNDHFIDKYSSIKLMFGTEDIESITTGVGEASTIIHSVLTSDKHKQTYGALSGWFPDNNTTRDNNKGFTARKEYYNGKISVKIFYPLKYLLGTCYDHMKVFYKVPNITLILNRDSTDTINKRIFFGDVLKTKPDTADPTKIINVNPSYITKKLEWWIPVLTMNLTSEKIFHQQLNDDKNIEIGVLKRRMAKTTFNVSDFTWTISEVKKQIRYVFVTFKTATEGFKKNNNLFTGSKIRKLKVHVNGEEYPEMKLNFEDGDVSEAYMSFLKACDYFGNDSQLNIKDYVSLYPIFCFNTTSQDETITSNSITVTIEKDGTDQYTAFCLMLEETHIRVNLGDNSIKKL